MRKSIQVQERYPEYYIDDEMGPIPEGLSKRARKDWLNRILRDPPIDLSDNFLMRYERVLAEYEQLQEELEQLDGQARKAEEERQALAKTLE
jgi:hypothetical protein